MNTSISRQYRLPAYDYSRVGVNWKAYKEEKPQLYFKPFYEEFTRSDYLITFQQDEHVVWDQHVNDSSMARERWGDAVVIDDYLFLRYTDFSQQDVRACVYEEHVIERPPYEETTYFVVVGDDGAVCRRCEDGKPASVPYNVLEKYSKWEKLHPSEIRDPSMYFAV